MSPARRFPIVQQPGPGPSGPGLVLAVARRSRWTLWLAAVAAVTALNVARAIGAGFHAPPQMPSPASELPLRELPAFAFVTACLSVCLVTAVLLADEAVARGARPRRSYVIAAAVASLAAATVQCLIRLPADPDVDAHSPRELVLWCAEKWAAVFVEQLLVSGMVVFVYVNLRTARQAGERRHAAELARSEAQRLTLKSRLQAMQARVEPQFLFNTLAQVCQLYENDPASAGRMLDDLIAYLRAALPLLRDSASTLGKEAELVRAYLGIVQMRQGHRLAFRVDVPPSLAQARMPPMMMLPLVDHALAQGLARSPRGGSIDIEAAGHGGRLTVSVADSGSGFAPDAVDACPGAIAERLLALYGDAASLRLERLPRGGSRAVLEIPHETTDSGHR